MLHYFLLILQAIMASALLWSSFCRLAKVCTETILEIRTAIYVQAIAALCILVGPYLPMLDPSFGWPALTTPTGLWLLLLAAQAGIQIVTARHWVHSVPPAFTVGGMAAASPSMISLPVQDYMLGAGDTQP